VLSGNEGGGGAGLRAGRRLQRGGKGIAGRTFLASAAGATGRGAGAGPAVFGASSIGAVSDAVEPLLVVRLPRRGTALPRGTCQGNAALGSSGTEAVGFAGAMARCEEQGSAGLRV